MGLTSGADCTPNNNERKSYKYMSYLSSFMKYNELSVLITFTKGAQNDQPYIYLQTLYLYCKHLLQM